MGDAARELPDFVEVVRERAEECLDGICTTLGDIGRDMLSMELTEVGATSDTLPLGRVGAYLPLLSDGVTVYVGLLLEPDGAEAAARALLCMTPDETLELQDRADAIGELANMLGGISQRTLKIGAALGLPMFVQGRVRPGTRITQRAREMKLGTLSVSAVLLYGPPPMRR